VAVTWPSGVSAAGVASGIKVDGSLDVGLLSFDEPLVWAGTFTRNAAAAAPVQWCRAAIGNKVRALVVNSGNANACTGAEGEAAVRATATAAAQALGCSVDEVLIASTGPIGVQLPIELLTASLPGAFASLSGDLDAFSRSIMTTDTRPKIAREAAGDASIVGVAKGAAMLAPNMATMLAFIATDVALDDASLSAALSGAVEQSFNRISVDACESTNDSVFLFSTGKQIVDEERFATALTTVCRSLAEKMVRDAEGGSRLVHVEIEGAADEAHACELARAVVSSALWKAAVHGADPNWGRIASALGSADRDLDLGALEIAIGSEIVFSGGAPFGSLEAAAKEMDPGEFTVRCRVGTGPGTVEFLTCDLSPEYVTLNATGTS
jgi:glutamate N-acetyltransferase/amino-acid N-acetyltransferase